MLASGIQQRCPIPIPTPNAWHNMCDAAAHLHFEQAVCVQAWAFIIAREVEAPQRFQAIQSHRAAQAILHQQTQYVSHLLETAVVAEDDGRHLLRSPSFKKTRKDYAFRRE